MQQVSDLELEDLRRGPGKSFYTRELSPEKRSLLRFTPTRQLDVGLMAIPDVPEFQRVRIQGSMSSRIRVTPAMLEAGKKATGLSSAVLKAAYKAMTNARKGF